MRRPAAAESPVVQQAHRAARAAVAKRKARTAVAVPADAGGAAQAPSVGWQRILRDEAKAARAHRDEVRAALHELDRHLDMGDELTRRLTLFPGCPVH